MKPEIWMEFEGGYKVSSLGRVMGKDGRIMKQGVTNRGYLRVGFCINGTRKFYFVHRLVALLFMDNPLNKPQVNHINGIKTDNRVENLEWCTAHENMRHAHKTGLKVVTENNHFKTNNPHKGKFGSANQSSKPVLQLSKDNSLIKEWSCAAEIDRELGIAYRSISKCCNGKLRSSGGFKWKFK